MHAILLLGGKSRRFWPLPDKALFPICGKTLLEHKIAQLKAAGISKIVVVGGSHNADMVKNILPRDATLVLQDDAAPGMHGALMAALPLCRESPVLIVSSNDVVEPSAIAAIIEAAAAADGGAILAQRVSRYFPGGYLTLEGNRVTGIIEKPGEGNEPSDLVNIVLHAHNDPAMLLTALCEIHNGNDDGYERAVQSLLARRAYHAVAYEGFWQPVKYPWHILILLERALQGLKSSSIHASAQVHPTAVIEGSVWIQEGAKILPHATLVGPCTIGKRSVIGTSALVRQSSIGDDCVIGFGTEVKGSVLSSHVWTHMSYIGDSVVGSNVAFGGGTVTGNYRLDEGDISSMCDGEMIATHLKKFGTVIGQDSRIGIRTAINPGIKIGGGSFIGGGCLLDADVPEKSFVTMEGGKMHVRPNRAVVERPGGKEEFLKKAIG
jgi:bifunctional UDP-N-acetylglucosamine pyrophosphorylase/glucosamine-1-phosphate N-acetyltransferase